MEKDKKMPRASAYLYGTFVVVALLVVAFATNLGNIRDLRPPEFSKRNMLQALWYQYKLNYLEPGTLRSLDKQRSNITTSEGQSYTMLRAVWMDDKETFDTAWQWTKDNLQRKDDRLISWLFGERSDGSYGILSDQGGHNTATDADEDIALALLFASKRWNDEKYFGDAILIVRDIWAKEVMTIGGKPYLLANNVEKTAPKHTAIVNPSYFSPYAYKIFADVDPGHDWLGLASTSYDVADRSIRMALDKQSTAFIPPDWIMIDKNTGEISAVNDTNLTTNFSFDAMRLPWRFAIDYEWSGDPRAKAILDRLGYFSDEWRSKGNLVASYSHDGKRLTEVESAATYGGVLGYFMIEHPDEARDLYLKKIESLYDPDESRWAKPQSYYDENWAWFGAALYAGELKNLYQ